MIEKRNTGQKFNMRSIFTVFCFCCVFTTHPALSGPESEDLKVDTSNQTRLHALLDLATTRGYNLIVENDTNIVGTVPRVEGDHTIEEALNVLLTGTPLKYTIENKRITIFQPKEGTMLPKVTVLGYLKSNSVSQNDDSQSSFPLYHAPLSIQTVNEAHIEKVQAREINDILTYINGIEYFNTSSGISESYYSRGLTTPISIDGMFYRRTRIKPDTSTIERIDVIHNPSANFLSPGGMINFVIKTPKEYNFVDTSLTGGPHDYYRAQLDLNRTLDSESKHGVRLAGSIETRKHVKDFVYKDQYAFSPSYSGTLPDDSRVTLSGYFVKRDQFANIFTIHESELGYRLPEHRTLSLPWERAVTRAASYAIDVKKNAGDWALNLSGNWNYSYSYNLTAAMVAPVSLFYPAFSDQPEYRFISYFYSSRDTLKSHGTSASAERGMTLFNTEGVIRLGVDYQRFDIFSPQYDSIYSDVDYLTLADHVTFNANTPDYSIPEPARPTRTGDGTDITYFRGVYMNQNWYLTEQLTTHFNLRYEDMSLKLTDTSDNDVRIGNYNEWTSQLGVVAPLGESLSTHLSYTESFTHQPIANISPGSTQGTYIDPRYNKQIEWQLRKPWLDGDLNSQLTIYRLKTTDISYTYISGPSSTQTFDAEDHISKGISVGFEGKISPNTEIIANANWNENSIAETVSTTDNRAIQNGTIQTSSRLNGTAKKIANFWIYHDISDGRFKKFDVGLGIKYIGDRYGDDANSFVLDSYATTDIFLKYHANKNLSVSFKVRNIFNEFYYRGGLETAGLVEVGERRGVYLTLNWNNKNN